MRSFCFSCLEQALCHSVFEGQGVTGFLSTECWSDGTLSKSMCVGSTPWLWFCRAWRVIRSVAPAVPVGSGGGLVPALCVAQTCYVLWRRCCLPAGDSCIPGARGAGDSPGERGMCCQVRVVLRWIGWCERKDGVIQWPQLGSCGHLVCVGRMGWHI